MMRRTITLACAALGLLLAGCASAPPPPPPDTALFRDDAFAPPTVRIDADDIFALSDKMKAFLASSGAHMLRESDPRRQLVDALYKRQQLALDYDSSTTRTASEAYASRTGNCLSLVIMTAAFAKALGLPVYYQQVFVDEAWSRSGNNLYVASGHVNLALESLPLMARSVRNIDPPLVVDFLPADELRGQRSRVIDESTVVAMFMNNRAAEAMADGRLDDAYWWVRAAMEQAPRFLVAYNTLGVIYLRHGLSTDATRVFSQVLQREPDNPKVMGNLVQALRLEGRGPEADTLAQRLAQLEPYPPFYWFNAGLQAMREHDYERARDMFNKELRREAYYHEFHFWLAQAELGLGNVRQARLQLQLAMQVSTTGHDHDLYAAKLDRLKALRTQ